MIGEDLSEVLSEFARTMLTDFPIQGILDHLVKRIVEIMPVTGAGVTLIGAGSRSALRRPRLMRSALRFEKLQSELGEGPCLAVYDTGERDRGAGSADARPGSHDSRRGRWTPGWRRCSRFRCTTATCGSARLICIATRRGRFGERR